MRIAFLSITKAIAICLLCFCSVNSYSQYSPIKGSIPKDTLITNKIPANVKTNIISIGFFSPLNHHISFEYNRQLTYDIMFAGQIGLIGPRESTPSSQFTNTTETSAQGAYAEVGIKLFLNPSYNSYTMKKFKVIEGIYFKPQFVISAFDQTTINYYYDYYQPRSTIENTNYVGEALIITFGEQWMIAHRLIFDVYGGFGCNFSNSFSLNQPSTNNYYSYLNGGAIFPIAVAGGINIGIPF